MRKLGKRIFAIICCIAVVFTGISVENLKNNGVQAADATPKSTISLSTGEYGFKRKSAGGAGHVNMDFTGVASNYSSNGQNFMSKEFSDKYITYGGGMTYEDLVEGLVSFYIATNSILQLNWESRTTTFNSGWSFTIAKGALLPYNGLSGDCMALDREYTFVFSEGNAANDNLIQVTGYHTTTFSLGKLSLWGNGTGSATSQFDFADSNVANFSTIYKEIHEDLSYADFIQFTNYAYSELPAKGIVMKYILDGGSRCLQITNWGSLRQDMKQGDRITFKKGLPIYYVGINGQNYKATLDATYVYECQGSNSDNTQTFLGAKLDNNTEYGLVTRSDDYTTGAQSSANPEQYFNIDFDANSTNKIVHNVNTSVLNDVTASEYIQIAGYTIQEAKDMGVALRFIPNANVIQVGFGEAAVDALEVGDLIYLKKGMTVIYNMNGTLCGATLDANYCLEITGNNGTNLSVRVRLSDTYSLVAGTIGQSGPEGGYKYYGVAIEPDEFENAIERGQGTYDDVIMKEYVSLSKHDADDLIADGSKLRWYRYLPDVFQGLRLYSNLSFADGEIMFFKEGLPVAYVTPSGKLAETRLDKNYGFVYNASAKNFTYDASLELDDGKEATVEHFGLDTNSIPSYAEGGNQVINVPITGAPFTYVDYYQVALQQTGAAQFIDDSVCENANMLFILANADVQVIQIQLTPDMVSELEVGDRILLKKDMPVAYSVANPEAVATLDDDYAIRVIEKNGDAVTVQVELTGTYSVANVFYHGSAYMDIFYGSSTDLNDAVDFQGMALGTATLEKYFEISEQSLADLTDKGYRMEAYAIPALRGIRVWYDEFDLKEGDILLLKKGLPITYTTTSGKTKTVYLDDTYGYIKNAETAFVYDAEVKEIKDPVINNIGLAYEAGFFTENNSMKVNITFEDGALPTTKYLCPNIMSDKKVQPYIQIGEYTTQELLDGGLEILFIPSAGVFQGITGNVVIEEGMEIVFKKGLTISYYDNGSQKAVLKDDYHYAVLEENDTIVIRRISYYNVSILVDGTEVANDRFREGTEIDLEQYRNTSKGKVMSIKVNDESIAGTAYVVSEDAQIMIENRADICVVMFRDKGQVCAIREYLLTDKKPALPYAPDMDGYDDSWEAFKLVNGVVYVDAIHTPKQTHPVVKLTGVAVETSDDAKEDVAGDGHTSPVTGDGVNAVGYMVAFVVAMWMAVLTIRKHRKGNEE